MGGDQPIFLYDPGGDSNLQHLRTFLEIAHETQRWHAVRRTWAIWTVLLGIACGLVVGWPGLLEERYRRVPVMGWTIVAILFLHAWANVWRWRRREARFRVRAAPPPDRR